MPKPHVGAKSRQATQQLDRVADFIVVTKNGEPKPAGPLDEVVKDILDQAHSDQLYLD